MQALIEVKPDLLACETVPCSIENCLWKFLESIPPTQAWISFSVKRWKLYQ